MSFGLKRANRSVSLRNTFKRLEQRFQLPDKYKGGVLEKWANYWKQLGLDYRQVVVDTLAECRQRPVKAGLYLSGLSSLGWLYHTNPTFNSFEDTLLTHQSDMCTVGEAVRNTAAYNHLYNLTDLQKEQRLQQINFAFFSVIFRRDFEEQMGIYKANCEYLKPSYLEYVTDRVVDVGILGRWIILSKKMQDFDVNEREWVEEEEQQQRLKKEAAEKARQATDQESSTALQS